MANTANLTIGGVSAAFGGTDLGHLMGGATFTYDVDTEEIKADKFAGVVDYALTAENLEITINMAETKAAAVLRYAFAGGEYDSSGSNKQIKFGRNTGYLIGAGRGAQLVLHPYANAANDESEDIVIYNAVPVDSVELNYEVDGQRVAEVTFRATVVEAQGVASTGEGYLGRIGPAIT